MMVQKQERGWDLHFRGIRSKGWCTSRICAVATIVRNNWGRSYRKCKKGVVNQLLYADDLVLMSETMELEACTRK